VRERNACTLVVVRYFNTSIAENGTEGAQKIKNGATI
jgi:hypothetical protein